MDILDESALVKKLMATMLGSTKKAENASPASILSKAQQISEAILKLNKLKYHKGKSGRTAHGSIFRFKVDIGNEECVLKGFVTNDTGFLALVLWDEGEQEIRCVVTNGFILKEPSVVRAIGSTRLHAWLGDKK